MLMSSLPVVVVAVLLLLLLLVSLPLYHGFVMEEDQGTLISNEIGATCEEYRVINCKTGQTPSPSDAIQIMYHNDGCSFDQCSSNAKDVLPSCLNEPPLPVFKQLGHMHLDLNHFFVKLKWNLLPESCGIEKYIVLFKFTSDNELIEGTSDFNCSDFQNTGYCKSYQVSNITDEIIFTHNYLHALNPRFRNHYKKLLLKVIAYPVYEWPLQVVDTPNRCIPRASYDWPGCEMCYSQCSNGPPQNFTVNQYEMDDGKFLTNISWTPQASDLKYYLHVNTSDGKQLYMIDGQTSHIILTAGSVPGTTWLESFSCDCHSTSVLNLSCNADINTTTNSSCNAVISANTTTSSSSSTVAITASQNPPLSSISTPLDSIMTTTSLTPIASPSPIVPPLLSTTNTMTSTDMPSLADTPSLAVSTSLLYYTLPVAMVTTITVVIAILVGVVASVKHRRYRRKDGPVYYIGEIEGSGNNTSVYSNYEVTLVYSHLTPEDDEKNIIAFTDLAEYDIKVNRFDPSVIHDRESKWLEQSCRTSSCVLCVVNEYFLREWTGEEIPSIALVSPLEKIFHTYNTKRRDCPKFLVILPSKSDSKYIPSDYFDRLYDMTDREGIAQFIQSTPKYSITRQHRIESALGD